MKNGLTTSRNAYVDSLDNCYVADGSLHIIATKHDTDTCNTEVHVISTKHKHFKVRVVLLLEQKCQKAKGAWPAIWFLGYKKGGTGGQKSVRNRLTRICLVTDQMKVTCAIHTKAYNHTIQNDIGAKKGGLLS